jgi:hypothetical protein
MERGRGKMISQDTPKFAFRRTAKVSSPGWMGDIEVTNTKPINRGMSTRIFTTKPRPNLGNIVGVREGRCCARGRAVKIQKNHQTGFLMNKQLNTGCRGMEKIPWIRCRGIIERNEVVRKSLANKDGSFAERIRVTSKSRNTFEGFV